MISIFSHYKIEYFTIYDIEESRKMMPYFLYYLYFAYILQNIHKYSVFTWCKSTCLKFIMKSEEK